MIVLTLLTPFVVAVAVLNTPKVPLLSAAVFAVVGTGVFARQSVRVIRLARDKRNYRLGFHGERVAAEELNQLMREGCHVFHDVPMEPYGNIDHVIVAPSGGFAVETKTRRKRKGPAGANQRDYG